MQKIFAAFAILFSFTLLFSSCGKSGGGANELVIFSYMSDEKPKKIFAYTVEEFKKQNPEIKVTVNTFAHEQFKSMLPNWLVSTNSPDVVTWFAGYRMQAFAEKGLLEPIDEIFPGGSFEEEFAPAFKGSSSYKGKVYFMPQTWYWWAIYYNKKVFEKNGITPPKTWEEFIAACEKLKKAGITPIAIGAKDTWTAGGWFDYMDSAVNGGDFHSKLTSGDISYTDPKVKESFKYIADLVKNGYIMPNASSYSWQEAAGKLISGDAGMYLMGQFIRDVLPKDKQNDIDFFQFPIVGDNTKYSVDTPTDGFMIPKNSKNKTAAKKFMTFLATKESQNAVCGPLGRLGGNKNVTPADAEAQKGLDMVLGATYAMQFYDRDAPEEMAQKGMNGIVEIIQSPDKIDAVLENLEKERKRIYNK